MLQLGILAAVLAGFGAVQATAQGDSDHSAGTPSIGPKGCPTIPFNSLPVKTFYLHNASQPSDGNEILTGFRIILDPADKLYLVPSQSAIVLRACPSEMEVAQKLLDEIDRPRKKYKVTYTLSEMDGGNKIGVQHVSIFMEEGQRTTLKSGSKVPIVTGSYIQSNATQQQQMTYLDIGTNFDVTALSSGDEITLKSKVEQSSVAEEKSGIGPQDPLVRQTVLENVSLLKEGKPQVLGSVDITGSTRRLEIEVRAEAIK